MEEAATLHRAKRGRYNSEIAVAASTISNWDLSEVHERFALQ